MLCIYLRTNSDLCLLQHKLIGFYNRDEKCLQRGTDWVFKYISLRFGFKGLMLVDQNRHIFSPDRTRQSTHKRGTLSLESAGCTGVPASVPCLLGGDTKCCTWDMDSSSELLAI